MTGPVTGRHDIEAIKRRLPHRYPFLMVDRIEESGPGHAIGIKNVTASEPFFQGHFPDRAVMPGTLIAEALMQTAAFVERSRRPDDDIGAASHAGANRPSRQLRCVAMSMKFRKAVVPGDRLRMEVRSVQVLEDMVRVKATARTEAGIVAFGTLHLVAPAMDGEDRE